jgi:hypothetical protein
MGEPNHEPPQRVNPLSRELDDVHAVRGRVRALAAIFGLFLAQQVPLTLAAVLAPAVYRKLGLPLEQFALFSIPLIPPATRWLWAPVVDRHFGRRSWIAGCTALAVLLYLGLAATAPTLETLHGFVALLTLISVVMATQDVAVDGYVVEALRKGEQAAGSRLRLAATEAGQLIAIGGLMLLYQTAGWATAVSVSALVLAVFTLPALLQEAPPRSPVGPGVLSAAFRRPDMQAILLVAAATAFPAGIASAIVGPFLVDKGLSIGSIGVALGLASSVAPVLSAFTLSPWLTRGRTLSQSVLRVIPFSACAPLGLFSLALWPGPDAMVVAAAVFVGSFLAAPGLILIYQARLGWTARASAGTEFSLQESVVYLSRNVLTAAVAGPFAALFGWPTLFAANAILAAGSLVILARMVPSIEALVATRDAV